MPSNKHLATYGPEKTKKTTINQNFYHGRLGSLSGIGSKFKHRAKHIKIHTSEVAFVSRNFRDKNWTRIQNFRNSRPQEDVRLNDEIRRGHSIHSQVGQGNASQPSNMSYPAWFEIEYGPCLRSLDKTYRLENVSAHRGVGIRKAGKPKAF